MIIEPQCLDLSLLPNPVGQTPPHRNDINGKSLEQNNKNKSPIFSKLVSQSSATNTKVMDI